MGESSIGFVGLGIMGLPMAANLAEAGYSLTVFNRTGSRAEALSGDRIVVADTPADVARVSDIIITMVSDSAAVEQVVRGHTRPYRRQ